MNTQQRYEALIRIQKQMIEWAGYQPEHHHKLHGGKEINECVQLCKKLVSDLQYELELEESAKLELYFAGDNSLAIHNIN